MTLARLAVVSFLAIALNGSHAFAEGAGWEYEFSSDTLASASIPRWKENLKDGGESSLTPEGIRLQSTQESTAFYQISNGLWSGQEAEVTIEFDVAVEAVADGAEFGAQLVIGDDAFLYVVNLPAAPMTRYRLVIKDGEASLYGKNGDLLEATTASNASRTSRQALLSCRAATGPPKFFFGDGSAHVGGVSVWRMLRFVHGPAPKGEAPPTTQAKPLSVKPPELSIDPVTRWLRVRYQIPSEAPSDLRITCAFRTKGTDWTSAAVLPLMSPTGQWLAPAEDKAAWQKGEIREQNAAGHTREMTWMPYEWLAADGTDPVEFRLQFFDRNNRPLGETIGQIEFRNTDVETMTSFSDAAGKAGAGYRIEPVKLPGTQAKEAVVYSPGSEEATTPLEIAPRVKGKYAVFLGKDSLAWVKLGQRPFDRVPARGALPKGEIFLGVHDFQGDSMKFLPRPIGTGTAGLRLSSVRFVPVPEEIPVSAGAAPASKILAGYFEPYSWAFWRVVSKPDDYRDAARIYREYGFDIVDTQFGRFGARLLYESTINQADRFFARETIGDPHGRKAIPTKSTKVWSMIEKTMPLRDMLQAANAEDLKLLANFGATICYPGTPIESEFSKLNPDLKRDKGTFLVFSEPKVQEYMLSTYREVLDMGAPGISLDFCRYPNGIDRAEDVTDFLRKLRALANTYPDKRSVLVRFPATGESKADCFDYRTWAKEKLVDYLCPGNIKMAVVNFDVAPYVAAASGTDIKVLPTIDLLTGPFETFGPLLRRAAEIYRTGADGLYIYQPDAYLFYADSLRDYLPLLKDPVAVEKALTDSQEVSKLASKNIYLHPPVVAHFAGYRASNDRIRFWLEGDLGPEAELWVGGQKLASFSGYPYIVGEEAMDSPQLLPDGTHEIQIRAKDGDTWFERSFTVTVAPNPKI